MKRKRIAYIQQRDMSECGTTCLAIIFKYYGLPNIQGILRERADVSAAGVNLNTLQEIAAAFGFIADGYKLEFKHLYDIDLPCIAHFEGNHFIVLYKVTDKHVRICDPAIGKMRLSRDEFLKKWNGIVLNLEPTPRLFQADEIQADLRKHRQNNGVLRKLYLSLFKPYKRVICEVLIASCLLQLMGAALPFFTQAILDKVITQKHLELLIAIAGGLLGLSVLQILLGYVRSLLLTHFKIRFEMDFFSRLFSHLIRLSQKYFDAHKKEDFVNRFQENLKIRNLFSSSILQSFINTVFILNFIIILFLYNVILALLSLLFIALLLAAVLIFTPRLKNLESKIFHKNEKAMGSFLDALLGIQTIKLLVLEKLRLKKWELHYQNALAGELHAEKTYLFLNSIMGGINIAGQVSVYLLGAYFSIANLLSLGQYVAFISIYGIIIASINSIAALWFMLMGISVTYEKLNDIFIQAPECSAEAAVTDCLSRPDIEFQAVSFRYNQSSAEPVLGQINLKLEYGSRVGIVGRNGSGKTTLVKLLTLLYPAYEGAILAGGRELRQYHPYTVRKRICMLPQNIYLFNGTIKENIKAANPEAGDGAVIAAAMQADLHDFVSSLFLGYNHKVGDRGDNLSSGQRLKIAFARLFLSDPEVIILDEASSVLDSEAEKKIFENIYTHFSGKTVLIIAHRLHTLKKVDKIITLERGMIAEQGTHAELVAGKGYYYNLMKSYLNL